jgi:hypothetical protein
MGRAWIQIDDRHALLWSSVVDAPIDYLTPIVDLDDDIRAKLAANGHSWADQGPAELAELVGVNRAGPDEVCLTPQALVRRYRDEAAYEAFELDVDDINPYTCDADGIVYWVPWAPDDRPESLDGLSSADLRQLGPRITPLRR